MLHNHSLRTAILGINHALGLLLTDQRRYAKLAIRNAAAEDRATMCRMPRLMIAQLEDRADARQRRRLKKTKKAEAEPAYNKTRVETLRDDQAELLAAHESRADSWRKTCQALAALKAAASELPPSDWLQGVVCEAIRAAKLAGGPYRDETVLPDGRHVMTVKPELSPDDERRLCKLLETLDQRVDEAESREPAGLPAEAPKATAPATNAAGPMHTPDFSSVCWHGTTHHFNKAQAKAVGMLWEAWKKGRLSVRQTAVGAALNTSATGYRLLHTFRNRHGSMHPAWGTMIAPAEVRGSFILAETESRKNHESRHRTRIVKPQNSGRGKRRTRKPA